MGWLKGLLIVGILCSCVKGHKYSDLKVGQIDSPTNKHYNPELSISALRKYCAENHYNTKWGIIINYAIPSGTKRFFLCDLAADAILVEGLVCHGSCNERFISEARFSNEVGSGCSSLGHYKIGEKYEGDFGTAYKLFGLDETNSNAYERFVVLHGHSCVPENEYDAEICNSLGCPTLNPNILKKIEPFLDQAEAPVIIWAIND